MKRRQALFLFSFFLVNSLFSQAKITLDSREYVLVHASDFDDTEDFKSKWARVYPLNCKQISEKDNQTSDLKWSFFNPPENVKTIIGRFAFDDTAPVEDGILKLKNRISLDGDTLVQDNHGEIHTNCVYANNNPPPSKAFVFDPKVSGMFEAKVKLQKTPGFQFEIMALPSRLHNKTVQEGNDWITTSPHTVQNNVNENGWCALYMSFFSFNFGLKDAIIPYGTVLWSQFDEKNMEKNFQNPTPYLQDEFFGTAYEWKRQLFIDDETWYDQWHVLSAAWDEEGFVTYIDGQQWAKVTYNENGAGLPKGLYQFNLVYRVCIGDYRDPQFGTVEIDNEWKEVQIDYIRFYKEEK